LRYRKAGGMSGQLRLVQMARTSSAKAVESPIPRVDTQAEFVMSAANVLHEGVSDANHAVKPSCLRPAWARAGTSTGRDRRRVVGALLCPPPLQALVFALWAQPHCDVMSLCTGGRGGWLF
jgi:hypothetical protein